ncbi:MAG: DUF4232 domain-containing protein [Candidatus Nanopelagicales bacterium]|nr:DUF4232 domain-containing protein [Candidatus Nanopelagicales bacterium]
MPTHLRARRLGLAVAALGALGVGAAVTSTAQAATAPACSPTSLSARVTGGSAGMSQPASYVTLTNTSTRACRLTGYPRITSAWTKSGRQRVSVTNGAVMNAPTVKPSTVTVQPKGHAWFAVGAATAYDPPLVTFERITVAPSASSASFTVRDLGLPATAPKGKAFPLGVTAFAAGKPPAS